MSAQPHRIHPRAGADDASTAKDSPLAVLVYRARCRDTTAWDDIVDRFSAMVWAIARRHGLSNADAAEVSRTTWLRLVDRLDGIGDPTRIGGWLATTARRESVRVRRHSDRQVPTNDDDGIDVRSSDDPNVAASVRGDDRKLWELVSRLGPRTQLLLTVFSAESPLSEIEIAQALHIPADTVGPTRRRCVQHLRRLAARRHVHLPPNVA